VIKNSDFKIKGVPFRMLLSLQLHYVRQN